VGWCTLNIVIAQEKRILELQSRNGKLITHRYPELVKELTSSSSSSIPSFTSVIKCKESVVLDGEIVVLEE
jgi:ATP-dependent DNA ligase